MLYLSNKIEVASLLQKMVLGFLCVLALFIVSEVNAVSCNSNSTKNAVRIGGLFPAVIKRNGRVDTGGIARQIAAVLAVEEMNNKTDGIWDTKLLQHKVELFVRDSQRDAPASVLATFKTASQSYGQVSAPVCGVYNPTLDGIHGVIGPASSGPTIDVQSILADLDVAQIGYSATSADLSNSDAYPFFVRTPPADNTQAEVMAILIKDLLRDEKDQLNANLVVGAGSYSHAGSKKFREFAKNYSIDIRQESMLKSTKPTQEEYDRVVKELQQSNCHLTVMFGQLDDIAGMLQSANASGYKSTWLVSESAISGQDRADLQKHIPGQVDILRGIFSTAPSNGYNRLAYKHFEQRWFGQASTQWMEGGKEVCSDATDASGQYIWRRTLNNGKEVCLGKDFELAAALRANNECNSTEHHRKVCESVKITQYAPFAYDAMQAMLFAFDALASRRGPGPLSVTAREVYEAMLAVNFSGISGQVAFENEGPSQGDRVSEGLEFVVYNHDGQNGFNAIGSVQRRTWSRCEPGNSPYPCDKPVFFDGTGNMPTVWQEPDCIGDNFQDEVSEQCDNRFSSRKVTFQWTSECSDGHCCKSTKPDPESIPCEYIPETSAYAILTFVMAGLSVSICIAVAVWMVINRDTREVIGSQPMFCVIILLGAGCMPISFGKIASYKCALSEWTIWFPFSICLSALAVKVLRVYLLFVKFTFKKNVASLVAPWKTFGWMIALITPMLLLLIVRTAVLETRKTTHPRNVVKTDFGIVIDFQTEQCSGLANSWDGPSVDVAVLVTGVLNRLYVIVMIFTIGFFSFNTRKVPQRFSESRWILIGFYNLIVAYVVFLLLELYATDIEPTAHLVVFAFLTVYMSMAIVTTLFVPKMLRVYKYRKFPERRNTSISKRKKSRAESNHESKEIQHILDQLEPVGAAAVEKLYRDGVRLKERCDELLDLTSHLRDENWKLQEPAGSLKGIVTTLKKAFSSLEVIESKKSRGDVMESKNVENLECADSEVNTDGHSESGDSQIKITADVMESKKRRHCSSPSFMLYDAIESKKDTANREKAKANHTDPVAVNFSAPSANDVDAHAVDIPENHQVNTAAKTLTYEE